MGEIEEKYLSISPLSSTPRRIFIYLPTNYHKSRKHYPVLYMFDGHNLFDDQYATYGTSWKLKKYLDDQELDLIVVGIECNHEGRKRLEEYCPLVVNPESWIYPLKSSGEQTAQWIVHTLKPYIEKNYRVSSKREHVGIGGSSMGGLMAMYMIAKYNDYFSKAACVSSTTDIDFGQLCDILEQYDLHKNTRIYLDFGSEEVKHKKTMARCIDRLLTINYIYSKHGATTLPNLVLNGKHNEETWASIVPIFLEFLYPNL